MDFKNEKNKYVDLMNKKLEKAVCPMCGHSNFTLADGYFANVLQPSLNSLQFGGQNIPCIAVVCTNCGLVTQHALGIIDPEALETTGKSQDD